MKNKNYNFRLAEEIVISVEEGLRVFLMKDQIKSITN